MADGASSLAPASSPVLVPCAAPAAPAGRVSPSAQPDLPGTIPSCRIFLDLFSGASAPVTNAFKRLGLLCLQPIDLLHGSGVDVLCPEHKQRLRKLCASGVVGLALAAPPCGAFSLARLKPGGPRPVRTPQFPDGLSDLRPDQARELQLSQELHDLARELLALVSMRGGIILFENPTSSLTWKTRGSEAWMRQFTPYLASVAACAHGMNAFKSWLFCCNHPDVMLLASVCSHPKGTHPSLSGKRSSDGTFLARLTALYPQSLADAVADIFKSALSVGKHEVPFRQWEQLLPARSPLSVPKRRIEDGCGTCSSASWVVPHEPDAFAGLRQAWSETLRSTGLLPQVLQRLGSSDKAAPVSDEELQPFLSALRHWLGVFCEAVWNTCLEVTLGQPFRLHLWPILAEISRDPDSRFTDQLVSGVSLGVRCQLQPCTVMAPGLPPDADPRPLECCASAWQSALLDSATVDKLLQEELQQGWIREVPGGLAALREQYRLCAVGKLGLVKATGRPPRLVVDSSVSAVTENTVLPNRSCNPTLAHLRRCLPLSSACEDLTALVLDVSKAHRRIKIRPQDQGLLCFHHQGKLCQCLTLNFGARASSYYWSRTAGLLCRLLHRMIYVNHSLMIYVDDLICLLRKCTSPLLAALIVIFLRVLKVPMSWHKASLSSHPVWIGWNIDLTTFTVCMESEKQQRLLHLLLSLLQARYASRHDVERLTGKLLWLSGLLAFLRPTLAQLYALQHSGQLVMAALTPEQWSNLRPLLSADLRVTGSIGHPSVPVGSTLVRLARLPVSELAHIPTWLPEPRRIWVQVSHRRTSTVLMTAVKCGPCGGIFCTNPPVGAFFWPLCSSVRLLPMLVPIALLWGLEGLSNSPLASSASFRCLSPNLPSSNCARSSPGTAILSILLPPGNFWRSVLLSGLPTACCPLLTLTCTSFFGAIMQLPKLLHGRVCPWLRDSVLFCANSQTCSVGNAFLRTLNMSLDSLMMLLTP